MNDTQLDFAGQEKEYKKRRKTTKKHKTKRIKYQDIFEKNDFDA